MRTTVVQADDGSRKIVLFSEFGAMGLIELSQLSAIPFSERKYNKNEDE